MGTPNPSYSGKQTKLTLFDDIADNLLKEKFLLTALELHFELLEAGSELPRLRDYFSNPANFDLFLKPTCEQHNPGLSRSLSQTTLDSLDWARYSEDGERFADEKIAVLEFELRKAKENIQSLRANLTQVTASQSQDEEKENLSSKDGVRKISELNINDLKPYQKKTINFLINEYLSMMGYKMTAITFADENDNQDFENWDDVGLNTPRPSTLPQLIFEKNQTLLVESECVACQTENILDIEVKNEENDKEVEHLHEKILTLENLCERQELELQKLHRRMSTPQITPFVTPQKERIEICPSNVKYIPEKNYENDTGEIKELFSDSVLDKIESKVQADKETLTDYYDKHTNDFSTGKDDDSCTLDNVASLEEMLESHVINYQNFKDPFSVNTPEEFPQMDWQNPNEDFPPSNSGRDSTIGEEIERSSFGITSIQLDDTSDMIDPKKCDRLPPLGACSDLNPQGILAGEFLVAQREEAKNRLQTSSSRQIPHHLENELLILCLEGAMGVDSRLQREVATLSLGQCDLLNILSMSLHNIVPNVILSKREELVPLLVYCISQNPESEQREKLLHRLFNLTKRPNKEQRSTILLGLLSLARVLRPDKIEAELLPQCWEQLSHKYSERRLLVAQSVAILAPYTPVSLRNSLLFSMIQELLSPEGEKDTEVIEAAVASLALLVSYLDDTSKLHSLWSILLRCLENTSVDFSQSSFTNVHPNISSVLLLYFSVLHWTLQESSLTEFIDFYLEKLSCRLLEYQKESSDGGKSSRLEALSKNIVCLIKALDLLCPYLVLFIYNSIEDCEEDEYHSDPLTISSKSLILVRELGVVLNNNDKAEECFKKVHYFISKKELEHWPEFQYVVSTFIVKIVNCITLVEANMKDVLKSFIHLVSRIDLSFGHHLRNEYMSPLFMKHLHVNENALDKIKEDVTSLTKGPLIVYAVGVLAEIEQKNDTDDLSEFISRNISILALCGAPNTAIQMSILLLLEIARCEETVLGALWSCVVHRSTVVRAASAPLWGLLVGQVKEFDLVQRVVPALVTLATDPEVTVRAASIAPLTAIVSSVPRKEVCDKIWLQLESVCEQNQVIENPALQMAIAQTCSFFGHNTPSQLLHQLYLPCLCRAALEGLGNQQEKIKFGSALLDAFTSLSSSAIPNHLVAHFILPPLNQLQKTLGTISVEYMETITILSKDYTLRAQSLTPSSSSERIKVLTIGAGLPIGSGVEDMKNRMSKILTSGKAMSSQLQAKPPSFNLPTLFKKK